MAMRENYSLKITGEPTINLPSTNFGTADLSYSFWAKFPTMTDIDMGTTSEIFRIRGASGDGGGWPYILAEVFLIDYEGTKRAFIQSKIQTFISTYNTPEATLGPANPLVGDAAISFEEWHFFVFTYDRPTGTFVVYVDGVNKTSFYSQSSNIASNANLNFTTMRILPYMYKNYFVSDLRFYGNKILSQSEVTEMYEGTYYTGTAATLAIPFNEGTGSPKTLYPSGSNQQTMTISNGKAEWSTDAPYERKNYSLAVSSPGSWVSSSGFSFGGATQNVSISVWFKAGLGFVDVTLLKIYNLSYSNRYYSFQLFDSGQENGTMFIYVEGASSITNRMLIGSGPYDGSTVLSYDRWNHFVFTFDKANNTKPNLYVNGVNVTSDFYTYTNAIDFYYDVSGNTIKGDIDSSGSFYVDDIRCFHKVLNAEEVAELYTSHSEYDGVTAGGAAVLVVSFDEGTGKPVTIVPTGANAKEITLTNCAFSRDVPWGFDIVAHRHSASTRLEEFGTNGSVSDFPSIGNTMGYII